MEVTSVFEDVDKLGPSYNAGVKWCSHCGKVWQFFKKTELLYDPAIPLLGIYSREIKRYGHTKLVHKCSQQHYSK